MCSVYNVKSLSYPAAHEPTIAIIEFYIISNIMMIARNQWPYTFNAAILFCFFFCCVGPMLYMNWWYDGRCKTSNHSHDTLVWIVMWDLLNHPTSNKLECSNFLHRVRMLRNLCFTWSREKNVGAVGETTNEKGKWIAEKRDRCGGWGRDKRGTNLRKSWKKRFKIASVYMYIYYTIRISDYVVWIETHALRWLKRHKCHAIWILLIWKVDVQFLALNELSIEWHISQNCFFFTQRHKTFPFPFPFIIYIVVVNVQFFAIHASPIRRFFFFSPPSLAVEET